MNENEFRKQLNDALGEPPRMATPMFTSNIGARPQPRLAAIIAFALAVVLVLVLVATRISFHPTANLGPAGKPASSPAPQAAADSFPCALPVVAIEEAGNPGQPGQVSTIAGFVNIPGGAFQVDPSADVRGLPTDDTSPHPTTYSPALSRWLPVFSRAVSPDRRSYLYVTLSPAGSTYSHFTSANLHVFDVAKKSDRKLWSYAGSINVTEWGDNGILVSTVPPRGGVQLWWLIDPASGNAVEQPSSVDPTRTAMNALPQAHSFSYLGADATSGQQVFRLGGRDAGTSYSVVLVTHGAVSTIYSGVAGDAKNFDPAGVYFDAHGLWFGNFDGSVVWLWTQAGGLKSFSVHGGPGAAAGYAFNNLTFSPAGACVPGIFLGAKPSPLPAATTPSPSPTPPTIDWSSLQARPLHLDQLASGTACPVSSSVDLNVKAQSGKWPNYGFGAGPAYISGQIMWYSAGSQGVVILVDPEYKGPVLIRVKRIDGAGSVQITGDGLQTLSDGYGLPQTSSPPYWGTWFGTLTPNTPGCYGIQLDGTSFSVVDVIEVKQGPPPPG